MFLIKKVSSLFKKATQHGLLFYNGLEIGAQGELIFLLKKTSHQLKQLLFLPGGKKEIKIRGLHPNTYCLVKMIALQQG